VVRGKCLSTSHTRRGGNKNLALFAHNLPLWELWSNGASAIAGGRAQTRGGGPFPMSLPMVDLNVLNVIEMDRI